MSDRQIVAKAQGQVTSTTRDQPNLAEWQMRLEQRLFAHLQRMTMEPDFLLEIEQKTKACFNLLMNEGVQQLQQHAANLSATAENELVVFREKAGHHVEERIQLASADAYSQASAHATRLREETEFHMNQQLRGLIADAKNEATELAVAEVKASLDRVDDQIDQRASHAIQAMIQHFDAEARTQIGQLLTECYSSARAELQTVADGHMSDIRRRVSEEIDRVLREVRAKEERAALTAIQTQAADETRILTVTIGNKLDAVFREVQRHQANALVALDARAEHHSEIVQQTVQRHVRTAWAESEAKFRAAISTEVASRLYDHSREMVDDVDERIRAALRDRKRQQAIESMVKSFVQQENDDNQKRQEEMVKAELQRGLQQLQEKVQVLIADATSKPADTRVKRDVDVQFQAIKNDIRDAVQDLDAKIAQVSRSVAVANPELRAQAVAIENENIMALVRIELHEALAAIDSKINHAAQRPVPAASDAPSVDSKEAFDVAIATRIQQEVQAAVGTIDARLQLDLRRSMEARLPPFATNQVMMLHEQELASVRRDFHDAIRNVESKIATTHNVQPNSASGTSNLSPSSGLNTSVVLRNGVTQHEILIRCQPDASPTTSSASQVTSVATPVAPVLERLEAESRAIERAMQDAWDAAADDSDGPDEPTELRVLTPPRIEAFLSQFETYKKAGGSRTWTGFVRPGLLAYVRACELSDGASDDEIFAYLQLQVDTNKHQSTAEFAKLFESVVADRDAATPAEQVQSVLMGMEAILSQRELDGLDAAVPIQAYGQIALSKLPQGFKARVTSFGVLTTKREIKGELLKVAAQLA